MRRPEFGEVGNGAVGHDGANGWVLRVAGGVAHPTMTVVGAGVAGNDDGVEPGGGRSSAVGGFAAAAS